MISPEISPGGPSTELDSLLFAERLRLTRDGVINTLSFVIAAIAGMVLVPVLLSGLSREMYGLWIAAIAIQYSASFLSGGLGRTVAREVAASGIHDSSNFVVAVSNAYFLIGIVGAMVIAAAGLALASGLHISPGNISTARLIFGLTGIGFLSDQVQAVATDILLGLRRFMIINTITSLSVLVRFAGIVIVLKAGGTIVALAAWHIAICAATAATAYTVALRHAPQFRPRLQRIRWSEMRGQLEFSLGSQITAGCNIVLWRSAPFLIGLLRGAAAIVPFELGQKFPISVSSISWQAADVLFPAASEYHSAQQQEHTRQLLEVGTRGVLLFTLPFCIVLWILAPTLLATWVGGRSSEVIWILRFITVAVLADSLAAGSLQVVWGQGRMKWASSLALISTIIGVIAAACLIVRLGPLGAAIGLTVGVFVSSAGFIFFAGRLCACNPAQILMSAVKDLVLPGLACAVSLLLLLRISQHQGWPFVFGLAAVCFAVYTFAFYFLSAQTVEKRLVRGVLLSLSGSLYSFYSESRRVLERSPLLRRMILYTVEIKNTLLDSSRRDRAAVEKLYREQEDPFGFTRNPEQFRFERAIEMLRSVSNGSKFQRVLEIGCAEGMFTKKLAPYCGQLLAVDLSNTAIDRARQHCSDVPNIEFAEWDVRQDPVDGVFDVIVATGVLEYVLRPATMRDIRERITAGLRPGGYLLLGNTVTDTRVEHTWIGRKLIRGTLINDYFANDSRYETIAASVDQCVCPFAHILLRKRLG